MFFNIITILCIIVLLYGSPIIECVNNKKFPKHFKFGVATSAYQIEGAWNTDGKGENIWDYFVHNHPERIYNHSTGDIACDSYNKYLEDVELVRNLNVNYYRFSLSWTRILPTGLITEINESGVNYYKNLIRELKRVGIEPFVTLYHWDLPQPLQELGGWTNPAMENYFVDYARLAFELFGDDVKYWLTFNEPSLICVFGYSFGYFAPGLNQSGLANYLCAYTVIKTHAKVYHIYDKEFRPKQLGKISIVLSTEWHEPASNSPKDFEAANRYLQFYFGLFAHPIYHPLGNYPKLVRDRVRRRSKLEGFSQSRLPKFTKRQIEYIRGTYDFFALNSYSCQLVKWTDPAPVGYPTLDNDMSGISFQDSKWEPTGSEAFKVTPWAFRNLLKWIHQNYPNQTIWITENGFSDNGETLEDEKRIFFLKKYLSVILSAIYEDGINVIGYTYWSLLDNFEWSAAYKVKFGLYHVDFNSPNRTRTAKMSAAFYRKVATTKCLTNNCE